MLLLKVRSIGVSNFGIQRTMDLLSKSRIKPAVNQIEVHPFLPQDKLLDFCTARGMKVVAYAPLGAPGYPYDHPGPLPDVFHHPSIKQIAASRAKTAAQVALRWAIQRGTVVIPKSVRRERIEENLNIFDFELSEEEMASINDIGRDPKDQIRAFILPFAADGGSIFDDSELLPEDEL